ncbi:zinc finger protein ZIC 5 [Echria macrotheca]|uniref:Zinc finger protein ZIC 5 n=1 Tax=Echria macrotheca TaxID=438768 RepID=A0AAJ0F4F6_9PEZI|nr:zinc finger protein ZIC 5 [Echria macrotheca]
MSYLSGSPYPYGDEILSYDSFYLDPGLQSQWGLPVHEFLKDNQRTAIFNADVSTSQAGDCYPRPTVGIPVLTQPASARFPSPISSIEPSSASGSAHSPPADTESYSDHPRTPPEVLSPYSRPAALNQWNAAHPIQFEGMGGPSFCVNPVEINPSQHADLSESEPDNFLYGPARTPSWDRYSQYETEPTSYQQPTPAITFDARRVASPDSMNTTEDEVNVASEYPPPPSAEPDMESDEDAVVIPPLPKRKMDEDAEWKPAKKTKNNTQTRSPARPRPKPRLAPGQQSPRRPRPHPDLQGPQNTQQAGRPVLPPSRGGTKMQLTCSESGCQKQVFADQSALDLHIKKKHTRPYLCVFHFAGCDSTFASKNEWKRHVASQHLLLHYWLCQEDECAKTCNGGAQPVPTNSNAAKSAAAAAPAVSAHQHQRSRSIAASADGKQKKIPNGNIFNRKDLYTQHMRRMHMPEGVRKKLPVSSTGSNKKTLSTAGAASGGGSAILQQWEDTLRRYQDKAMRSRCALPEYMRCPADGCSAEFRGPDAWDQRMEHVARHLDRAAQGSESPVAFGGERDRCLTQWAGSGEVGIIELVGGRWVLRNRAASASAASTAATAATAAAQGGDNKAVARRVAASSRQRLGQVVNEVRDEIVVGEGQEEDDEVDAEGDMDDELLAG